MMSKTVGSSEALLRLLIAYEGGNCVRANSYQIWREIAAYVRGGGAYEFYPREHCKSDDLPAGEFYSDLEELVTAGYVRLLPSSQLEVTDVGNWLALGKEVPETLASLERQIATLGRQGSISGR